VDVDRGGLFARVSDLASGGRFQVHTPTSAAGVRGTEFGVTYDPQTNETSVAVVEGSVVILPREVAEEILERESGADPELARRVVDQLYESSTVIEADEMIVIGPEQEDALRSAADAIFAAVRELAQESPEQAEARLSQIGEQLQVDVAAAFQPRRLPPTERRRLLELPGSNPPAEQEEDEPEPAPDSESSDRRTAPPPSSDTTETVESTTVSSAGRADREAAAYRVNRNVAAMYYPWFGNPEFDGDWNEWDREGRRPPAEWASEYEPLLGLYSSRDPEVLEQHMQWVRRAGIGTLIVPWFGPDSNDDTVRLVMQAAERYDIHVAVRIEGDVSEDPALLPPAITFLMREFAPRRNYARIRSSSPSNPAPTDRPLVLLFAPDSKHARWASAMQSIRSQADYPFVVASGFDIRAVTEGGMDGIALGPIASPTEGNYTGMRLLPRNAIFMPSITPGFVSISNLKNRRSRLGGQHMEQQLEWGLNAGATPRMIVVTSFNRWSDGSQIEPVVQGTGASQDYGSLGSFGYLDATREITERFAGWEPPRRIRLRIEIENSSDWAQLILDRVDWGSARIIQDAGPGTETFFDWDENILQMNQPIALAQKGNETDVIIELDVRATNSFELGIVKGNLGETDVDVILLPSPGGPERAQRIGEFGLGEPQTKGDLQEWFTVQVR
jgi:hypothetical protein